MKIYQIVKQLESCNFSCEAGPLVNNVAFAALKDIAEKEAAAEAETIDRKFQIRYECKRCGKDTHWRRANYCTSCGTKIDKFDDN